MQALVASAASVMQSQLQDEIERLEVLSEINDHVRADEITAARQQKTDLESAIGSARLRLDALRLILRSA